MSEEWRPAPRLEGYEVSSLGRMRSWRNRRGWPLDEPVLVGHVNGQGYEVHRPTRRGAEVKIHRLVCEAFNGPAPFPSALVRHLDDVRTNNVPSNLAWGTHADNVQDRTRNGKSRSSRNSRFTDDQVRAIRMYAARGYSGSAIAGLYGVTPGAIYAILKGRSYRWVL